MSYVTVKEIFDYEVYNLSASDIPSLTVSTFINDAQAIVDGYAANLYSVPFATVPDLIKKVTRDISGFECLSFLHQKQNRNTMPQSATDQYNRAIELLGKIADGTIKLIAGGSVVAVNASNIIQSTNLDMPPIINMDNELEWGLSNNLEDKLESDRSL